MAEFKWPSASEISDILDRVAAAWNSLIFGGATIPEIIDAWSTPGLKGTVNELYIFSGLRRFVRAYAMLTATPTYDPTRVEYGQSYFMMSTGLWQSTAYEIDGYQVIQPAGILTVPLEKLVCAIAPLVGFSVENEAFFHTQEWYDLRDACVQYLWDRSDVAPVLITRARMAYIDARLASTIKQQILNFSGQMENGIFFFPPSSYLGDMFPGERERYLTNEVYYRTTNPLGLTTYVRIKSNSPLAVFGIRKWPDSISRYTGICCVSNRSFDARFINSSNPIPQWDEALATSVSYPLQNGTFGSFAGLRYNTLAPGDVEIFTSGIPIYSTTVDSPSGSNFMNDAASFVVNTITANVDGIVPWTGSQPTPFSDIYVFDSPDTTNPYTPIYIDPSTNFQTWNPSDQPDPVTETPYNNTTPYVPTYQTPLPTTIPDPSPQSPGADVENPSNIVDPGLIDWWKDYDNTIIAPEIEPPSQSTETYPLPSGYSGAHGASGMIHVYRPSPTAFNDFAAWLWVKWSDPISVPRFWNNPIDGIVSAHELYWGGHASTSEFIRSGFLESTVSAPVVDVRYDSLNCGAIEIPEYFHTYMDYSPYCKASIYLPFVGVVELNVDDIVGSTVQVIYHTDSYTGACLAQILCNRNNEVQKLYEFNGNCAVTIPLSGGTQANIVTGLLQAGSQAINGLAPLFSTSLKSVGQDIVGGIGSIVGAGATALSAKSSVQHSGTFSSNYGAMGSKKPYLIIRRPVVVNAVNFNLEYGYPAHKRVTIGACSGYLRVREVNVVSSTATNEEKARIEELLKAGVYVS